MKLKSIPNSSIQVPAWVDTTALTEKFDAAKRARNQYLIRKLKAKFFGGAK
ncbi:hypothetical protein [Shewanella sp. TB7-MNA-CIBAN-0143]|uniref:hypothetical protein n=1 Tax=Shewanella sp. TB7-MNA-CIBAN-0143 TaxID=3140465 RepID=UPI0033317F76